jgi:hypothetical protein
MQRTDAIHFGLMLAALALTYFIPFELLLLSYAVLGPAHYLTEISWLHDRNYFLPDRGLAYVLALLALALAFVENARWFGFFVWVAFVICIVVAGATNFVQRAILLAAAAVLAAVMFEYGTPFAVVGILLPTLVHVSLFTLVFMVLGAHRAGSKAQAALLVAYVASIAVILVAPPSAETIIPAFAALAREYFGNVAQALGRAIGIPDLKLDTRFTSLLAFIYTYHYLNWFIKADVIRWNRIPLPRLALVAAVSVGSTALYFYNFVWGFSVLLALSLMHVFLEFPLNGISLRELGRIAGRSFKGNARPASSS